MREWSKIAANYRPMEGDVLHPDDCVEIRIKGAVWRVRPLQLPRGIMYTPEFGDTVSLKQTVDPLGNKPMQDRAEELITYLGSNPEGLDGVLAVCIYLGELLDQQYDIGPDVKSDLLSFRGDEPPAWYEQAIRHASGLSPQVSILEMAMAIDSETQEEATVAPPRPWWKVW
jgi:hypothetical protein